MVEIWLDLETTGTSTYKHGVWQLASIFYENNRELESFEAKFKLFPHQEIDPEALKTSDQTPESIALLPPPGPAFDSFRQLLKTFVDPFNKQDKMYMYGYNVRFDADFLRQWFYNNRDKYYGSWFWFPPVDVMNTAAEYLKNERYLLSDFKQGTVAQALGLQVDEAQLHDALYDIRLCREIYHTIKNNNTGETI